MIFFNTRMSIFNSYFMSCTTAILRHKISFYAVRVTADGIKSNYRVLDTFVRTLKNDKSNN